MKGKKTLNPIVIEGGVWKKGKKDKNGTLFRAMELEEEAEKAKLAEEAVQFAREWRYFVFVPASRGGLKYQSHKLKGPTNPEGCVVSFWMLCWWKTK